MIVSHRNTKMIAGICAAVIVLTMGVCGAGAARKKAAPPTPLTETGQKLEQRYAGMLAELKAEIAQSVSNVDARRKAAYQNACKAEKDAEAQVNAALKNLDQIRVAQGLVGHAKGKWIGGADRGIAAAKAKLKSAKTAAERQAAQKELANWQKNRADGVKALQERQAKLDAALRQEPKWKQELEAAQSAYARAKERAMQASKALGLDDLLCGDALDGKLAKCVVLLEATPRGLAEFAQQSQEREALVEKLLADSDLMKQMVVADGAQSGKYGQAMKIYTIIRNTSAKSGTGVLQRLALAISLEHAVPISQRNASAKTEAPATVDPVRRYLQYEKAFLNNELDPAFKMLSVWDMRMVVNGEEPDEILVWGREMLRNYRPDHITTNDYRWRYVALVRTDIRYGSQDNKYDKPELQFFQNILMNGGVCGRRAFIGRFILRAFGIPTIARPQRGHAALAHWTPDGWVVCLGGGWGAGWTKSRMNDLDFLAITQARATGQRYLQVKRAQWIGDVMGENRVLGFHGGTPDFWYGLALYRQRAIIEQAKAKTLAAVGEELGEANESNVKYAIETATVTEADRKVEVCDAGVIKIPAAACSKPTKSTGKIIFMPSVRGGLQLHYSRNGGTQPFEYTINAPKAGKYALTAEVVTPSWQQHLLVAVNGDKTPTDIELPHTVGLWDRTKPVVVTLAEGKNVLQFSHRSDGQAKGFSIKEFTLKPVN